MIEWPTKPVAAELDEAVGEAIEVALARLLTNYGQYTDEANFAATLALWKQAASDNQLTAALVERARDWFLYKDAEREKAPPLGVFLDACRRFREIDERRAAASVPDAPFVPAPFEEHVAPDPNKGHVVHVAWSDGETSDVTLEDPARRHLPFEVRQRRALNELKVEIPNWMECLCGKQVYEWANGKRSIDPAGKTVHVCKWSVAAQKERKERGR